MPSRDAEWHAFVELILSRVFAIGVHRADQLVTAVGRALVEQRGRLVGIESEHGFQPVPVLREVDDRLLELGMKRLEAVGLGGVNVLVLGQRALEVGDEYSRRGSCPRQSPAGASCTPCAATYFSCRRDPCAYRDPSRGRRTSPPSRLPSCWRDREARRPTSWTCHGRSYPSRSYPAQRRALRRRELAPASR